jgi:small subunit ribosomal protein S4
MKSGMAVGKMARRLGVAPTIKTAKILQRRPNPPGVHGGMNRRARSVYGNQLIEKQKLRFQFMVSETALRIAYRHAKAKKGSTALNLVLFLDERLDATIFRAGVVRSVMAARQLITHRHVRVNGRVVDKPSFRLRLKDIVTFSDKSRKFAFLVEGFRDGITAAYLAVDREQLTIQRIQVPEREQIPVVCEEQMIVEWYSR